MGPVVKERRQLWRTGFVDRRGANRALTDILGTVVDKDGDPHPEERTLREYAETWIQQQESRVRASTLRRYEQIIRDDLLPILGDLRLDHIRPSRVRDALDAMAARGCSAGSVRQGRAVLSSMMRQAVEDGLVPVNPCSVVRPPKGERRKLAVPDATQLAKVLTAARGSTTNCPSCSRSRQVRDTRRSWVFVGRMWTSLGERSGSTARCSGCRGRTGGSFAA